MPRAFFEARLLCSPLSVTCDKQVPIRALSCPSFASRPPSFQAMRMKFPQCGAQHPACSSPASAPTLCRTICHSMAVSPCLAAQIGVISLGERHGLPPQYCCLFIYRIFRSFCALLSSGSSRQTSDCEGRSSLEPSVDENSTERSKTLHDDFMEVSEGLLMTRLWLIELEEARYTYIVLSTEVDLDSVLGCPFMCFS